MSIKRSPVLIALSQLNGVDLKLNQHYSRVTDDKGRYLPFDEFCRRTSSGENVSIAWTLTRRAWLSYATDPLSQRNRRSGWLCPYT